MDRDAIIAIRSAFPDHGLPSSLLCTRTCFSLVVVFGLGWFGLVWSGQMGCKKFRVQVLPSSRLSIRIVFEMVAGSGSPGLLYE